MRGMGCRNWLRLCALFPNSVFYCCCWEGNTRWDGWLVGPRGMLPRVSCFPPRQNEKFKVLLVGWFWCFQVKEISDIPHRWVLNFFPVTNQFLLFLIVCLFKTAGLSLLIPNQLVWTWSNNVLSFVPLSLHQLSNLTSTISSWLCDHLAKKKMGYHTQGYLDLTTVSRVCVWNVEVSPNAYLRFPVD